MLMPAKTSLICPCNDLESKMILEIAHRLEIEVYEIKGDWGLTLADAFAQIADLAALRAHVLIVELPDKSPDQSGLAQLMQLGKMVHVIDHHQYGTADKTQALSSLEQFAQLMNYGLSESELKIAINDRDFLMGLARAGVPWQEAMAIRQQEWQIRGTEALMQEAQDFVAKQARDLVDLRLVLAPERLAGVMLEAAQLPTEEAYNKCEPLKPVLVLYYADEDKQQITQVEYAGKAADKAVLHDVFLSVEKWQRDFVLWLGGGDFGCFFGAKKRHVLSNFDELVSTLLELFLQYGRPLRHYGCTFYVPLDLFLEDELKDNKKFKLFKEKDAQIAEYKTDISTEINKDKLDQAIGQERQAYLYFLPHIRDLVFDTAKSQNGEAATPIKQWKLKNVTNFHWYIELNEDDELSVKITDISIFGYYNDLYVLSISVVPTYDISNTSLANDNVTWWHDLVFSDHKCFEQINALQLQNWLLFTNQARLIYPSFAEQFIEGKLKKQVFKTPKTLMLFNEAEKQPEKRDSALSPILVHLLKYFFDDDKLEQRLSFLPDDRMFACVAYGLSGLEPKTEQGKAELTRLFSLALYVDHKGGTFESAMEYAYDAEFTQALMQTHTLNRWQQLGTYSGYCSYANAYMGFGWFFNAIIAPSHVPFIYIRMMLLGLFYQMTLRHYKRRVGYETEALSLYSKADAFRDLRKKFILFNNNYWFREVTNQTQGIEVFNLQIKALELDKDYNLIKDEMERADEYAQSVKANRFNVIATVFVIITLFITFFTVSGAPSPSYFGWVNWLYEKKVDISLGVLGFAFLIPFLPRIISKIKK